MPVLELSHAFSASAVDATPRVRGVAAMFGLGLDAERTIDVVPTTRLPLRRGQVVFVTGPSGGGKSTLLRCLRQAWEKQNASEFRLPLLDFAALPAAPESALVDALPTDTLDDALRCLALAGLNDAFVILRRPSELSDGQRYRFTLARLMASVEALPNATESPSGDAPRAVVVADEFGAALDRLTAKVLARNVRKWVDRSGVCAVLATTHDDLLEALRPDVLIEQHLGGRLTLSRREGTERGTR